MGNDIGKLTNWITSHSFMYTLVVTRLWENVREETCLMSCNYILVFPHF